MMKFKGHTLFVTAILLVFGLLTGCASNTPTASDTKKSDNLTINIGIQQSLGPLLIAKGERTF